MNEEELNAILEGIDVAGQEVCGYVLQRIISRSRMSLVFHAVQKETQRKVAFKILRTTGAKDPNESARFKQEARLARKANHPNVISVVESDLVAGRPFYTMNLVEGRNLEKIVQEDGRPPVLWAVMTMAAVASALHRLHEIGIIHRDMKPSNVLIESDTTRPVLVDLGIAKRFKTLDGSWSNEARGSEVPRTAAGQIMGTPAYMAPEQIAPGEGGRRIGKPTDIYGFGATLYYALTGLPPFAADDLVGLFDAVAKDPPMPLREVRASIPPALERLVHNCLAKVPSERPWSIIEVERALELIAVDLPEKERGAYGNPWRMPNRQKPPEEDSDEGPALERSKPTPEKPERFGDYLLIDEIGADATGVFYAARQGSGRRALLLKRAHVERPGAFGAFRREAQLLAQLRDRFSPRVLSANAVEGLPFYTTEAPSGETVEERVTAGRLPKPEQALDLVQRVAKALTTAAEAGLVHRDLRPCWIYMDGPEPMILGFSPASQEGPEARAKQMRRASFALAAILYRVLTGQHPNPEAYEGGRHPLRELCPEAPRGVGRVLGQVLSSQGDESCPEPGELAALLNSAVHERRGITGRLKKLFGG